MRKLLDSVCQWWYTDSREVRQRRRDREADLILRYYQNRSKIHAKMLESHYRSKKIPCPRMFCGHVGRDVSS